MGWKADAGFLAVLGVGVLALAQKLGVVGDAGDAAEPHVFDICDYLPAWWPGCGTSGGDGGGDGGGNGAYTATDNLLIKECCGDKWHYHAGNYLGCCGVDGGHSADVRICPDHDARCSQSVPAGCVGVQFRPGTAWTGRGCTFSVPVGGVHPWGTQIELMCPYDDAGGVLRG